MNSLQLPTVVSYDRRTLPHSLFHESTSRRSAIPSCWTTVVERQPLVQSTTVRPYGWSVPTGVKDVFFGWLRLQHVVSFVFSVLYKCSYFLTYLRSDFSRLTDLKLFHSFQRQVRYGSSYLTDPSHAGVLPVFQPSTARPIAMLLSRITRHTMFTHPLNYPRDETKLKQNFFSKQFWNTFETGLFQFHFVERTVLDFK